MAKKPIKKKASTKKKSSSKVVKKATPKKGTKKSAAKKKSSGKKVITEKEREIRAANLIANSEKKKGKEKRKKRNLSSAQEAGLLKAILEGMQEKKAKNIAILDLTEIENRVSDFFVICDADSKIHVESIADSVEEIVEKMASERAFHSEGRENSEWILIDYINIVVHVFLREAREHYNLEALWGDAKMELIN